MKNKESYLKKLADQLRQKDAEIAELKARAEQAKADSKSELFKHIDELHEKTETARDKLKQLQAAEDGAWEDMKTGVEKSWNDLKGAFSKASERFK